MAGDATSTSLRETSRWLVRLAEVALAIGGIAFFVLLVTGAGLVQQVREAHRVQAVAEADTDTDLNGTRPTTDPALGGTARSAASIVSWTLPIALLAGIGAAVTAHRASELSAEEASRRLAHFRRPPRR